MSKIRSALETVMHSFLDQLNRSTSKNDREAKNNMLYVIISKVELDFRQLCQFILLSWTVVSFKRDL